MRTVSGGQPDVGVHQAVQRLCSFRQLGQITLLERFRERVEQAPDTPALEGRMPGFTSFLEDGGNDTVAAHSDIGRTDDEIVGVGVRDLGILVSGDAFVLMMPLCQQQSDGTADELGQVTQDVTSVLAGELDLSRKAQIITNEDLSTGDDASREGLVVRVPNAENPGVIRARPRGMHFHQSKVAMALMRQGMCLGADTQVGGLKRLLDGMDELMMRNGAPGVRGIGSGNAPDFGQFHMGGSTVEHEVGLPPCDGGRSRVVEVCDHDEWVS